MNRPNETFLAIAKRSLRLRKDLKAATDGLIDMEEPSMLSIRDCLDYCDITDEEVALIAEHEGIPDVAAAQVACGMVQTPEGVLLLTNYLQDLINRATQRGQVDKAEQARSICARFMADHPVSH